MSFSGSGSLFVVLFLWYFVWVDLEVVFGSLDCDYFNLWNWFGGIIFFVFVGCGFGVWLIDFENGCYWYLWFLSVWWVFLVNELMCIFIVDFLGCLLVLDIDIIIN